MNILLFLCQHCYGIWIFQLLCYFYVQTAMLSLCLYCNAISMFILLSDCYVHTATLSLFSNYNVISMFKLLCYFYVYTAMLSLCPQCYAISMSLLLFLPMMPTACSCRLRCGKLQRSRSNFVRIWTERIVLDSTNIVGLVFAVLKWQQEIVLVFFKKMGHPRPLLSFIFNIFKQTLPFLQW